MKARYRSEKLLLVFALVPLVLHGILVYLHGVDVPFWDQWNYVPFFVSHAQGTLTFNDLWALQNEFRQFFPNLIIVFLGSLTGWNTRWEMGLYWIFACACSLLIYMMSRSSIGERRTGLFLFLLANLCLFSPIQYENWLFGVQIVYILPLVCTLSIVGLLLQQNFGNRRLLLCICLAVISSFSSANGVAVWLTALPAILWKQSDRRVRWKFSVLWLTAAALCALLYLHGYESPAGHPELADAFSSPTRMFLFVLILLGRPLDPFAMTGTQKLLLGARLPEIVSLSVAIVLISIFLLSFAFVHRRGWTRADVERCLPWWLLGSFALLSAALVAVGRTGFGLEQALAGRYTTLSLPLIIADIYLFPLSLGLWRAEKGTRSIAAAAAVVPFFLLTASCYIFGAGQAKRYSTDIRQGKACLLFVNLVDESCSVQLTYPSFESVKSRANLLDSMQMLRPALILNPVLKSAPGLPVGEFGRLESVTERGATIEFQGWAMLPHRSAVADGVVISYQSHDGQSRFLQLTHPVDSRTIAQRALGEEITASNSRFSAAIPAAVIPKDAVSHGAWAFDSQSGELFPLR